MNQILILISVCKYTSISNKCREDFENGFVVKPFNKDPYCQNE